MKNHFSLLVICRWWKLIQANFISFSFPIFPSQVLMGECNLNTWWKPSLQCSAAQDLVSSYRDEKLCTFRKVRRAREKLDKCAPWTIYLKSLLSCIKKIVRKKFWATKGEHAWMGGVWKCQFQMGQNSWGGGVKIPRRGVCCLGEDKDPYAWL